MMTAARRRAKSMEIISFTEPVADWKGEEKSKTQDEWAEHWGNRGNDFISMADYYTLFRQIAADMESDNACRVERAKQARKKMGFAVGLTSTRVAFEERNDLEGEVIHNYKGRRQRSAGNVLVPPHFSLGVDGSIIVNPGILRLYDGIYRGSSGLYLDESNEVFLERMLRASTHPHLEVKGEDCMHFLQALFNTEDDLETMCRVLYTAYDYSDKGFTTNIYVNTDVPTYGGLQRSCGFKTQINFAEKRMNVEIGVLPAEKNYGYCRGVIYDERGILGRMLDLLPYRVTDIIDNLISYAFGAGAGAFLSTMLYTDCAYHTYKPSDPSYMIAPAIVGAILGLVVTAAARDGSSGGGVYGEEDERGKYCQGK
jgi:hypothetical protein